MKVFKNKEFSKAIKENLKKTRNPFDSGITTMEFGDIDYYLWGGFVRDTIFNHIYEKNMESKDIDYLVDPNTGKSKGFYSKYPFSKRFEDYEWQEMLFDPHIIRIWFCCKPFDFVSLDYNNKMLIDPNSQKGLQHNLECVDLNTSAIAYSPHRDEFYDAGAMAAIKKGEIDFSWINPGIKGSNLSRLILHAEKLNFKIGKKAIEYISKNYSKEDDKKIKEFLVREEKESEINQVLTRLKNIKSNLNSTY